MTNPYQEPQPDTLTFAEAVRAIAERTAFRSEAERDAVYAACDQQAAREGAEVPEPDAETEKVGPTGDGDADLKTAAAAARTSRK